MIHYKACLEQYNWSVDIYVIQYKHDLKYLDCIVSKYNLPNKIYDKLTNRLTNYINSGFIYNCDKTNHSIIFVGESDSIYEAANTLAHEKNHLEIYLCKLLNINPESEDAAILSGDITEQLINPYIVQLIK